MQWSYRSFLAQILNNESVSKNFSVLANIRCWFAKSFFFTYWVIILQFWERITKNEDFLRLSQLKNDCDLIRRRGAFCWKAYNLSTKLDTHHVTVGCSKRKIRPLFHKTLLQKRFNSSLFWAVISFLVVWVIVKSKNGQQLTFVQLKMDCCVTQSWNFLSRIAMLRKIISSTKFEQWECFKIFFSPCKHLVLICEKLFLHSLGDYFAILRENHEQWRLSSSFAIKKWLWPY